MTANFPDYFKTVWIFPSDCQFSGLFQNCPDFSRWLPIFRMISKLSIFFKMTANFLDDFKSVWIFQMQMVTTNAANFVRHTNFCLGGRVPKIPQKSNNFCPKNKYFWSKNANFSPFWTNWPYSEIFWQFSVYKGGRGFPPILLSFFWQKDFPLRGYGGVTPWTEKIR